jgi:hypothetical protein
MRAVHLFIASAVFVLGASFASVDRASAQALLQAAPPADSSSRTGQPRIEDVKFETDTAQPPKAGSAVFFNRGVMQVLTPRTKAGKGPASNVSR